MYKEKRVVVVMPAFNAARTLSQTYDEVMKQEIVDQVIIVDDCSQDNTVEIAKRFPGAIVFEHKENLGYGGNQKTCYRLALEIGADVIVMIHPDYQYTPKLLPAMVALIGNGLYSCVLGSRILGGQALKGGMPMYKYVSNRVLTFIENVLLGAKLSEYHTGYRAFSRELLESLDLTYCSDDFIFDNEVLAKVIWDEKIIAEITCPTKYFKDASSISFARSMSYGIGCLSVALQFRLAKMGLCSSRLFQCKSA